MFAPGDLVECVDAGPILAHGPYYGRPSGLTLGAIYTIETAYPAGSPAREAGKRWPADFVDVREVAHPDPRWAFPAQRFRLLKRRDPDLVAKLLREPVRRKMVSG